MDGRQRRLLEQRLARQAILLKDFAKALEALNLDLPHPLPGQADLQAYVFQRAALMAAQAEAAYDHLALLVGQFREPLIDALRQVVVLQQFAWIGRTVIRQGVQQGFIRIRTSETSTEETRSFRPSMRLTSPTDFSSKLAISSGEGS